MDDPHVVHVRRVADAPDGEVHPEPFDRAPTPSEINAFVKANKHYRHVMYTAPDRSFQMVAMYVQPGRRIPGEVHDDNDQYFLVKRGFGEMVLDKRKENIKSLSAWMVQRGTFHEISASQMFGLHLLTIYFPAHHPSGRVDHENTEDM